MARILAVFIMLIFAGCYYGSMQGAHTLGEGHITVSGNLMVPAYLSADDRAEAEESGEDYLETYPSFCFSTGAADNIDIGFSCYGFGLGPHVKLSAQPHTDVNALSAMLNVNYVLPVQVISPKVTIAAGRMFGTGLEFYGGYEAGYGPDLANIPEDSEGEEDWDAVENTYFHGLRVGCHYELKPPGTQNTYSSFVPEAIGFEFTLPLGLTRNMVVAGIGVTY